MHNYSQLLSGEISHNDYYNQFVTNSLLAIVRQEFQKRLMWMSEHRKDKGAKPELSLDDIPLKKWDEMAELIPNVCLQKMAQANGGGISLSERVCLVRAAARQVQQEILAEQDQIREELKCKSQ